MSGLNVGTQAHDHSRHLTLKNINSGTLVADDFQFV